MRLLNLHCHSTYSDGSNSMEEIADAYMRGYHTALVLTDHDYLMTEKSWEAEVEEAQLLSERLNYPIIIGLEAHVKNLGEEVLIFGAEACRSWFSWRRIHGDKVNFLEWHNIQKERESYHPFALILAHPYLLKISQAFCDTMDGYEISNGGLYWGDFYVDKMKALMPRAAPYHGIDLHHLGEMSQRCNEIDDEDLMIRSETDLIHYIKSRIT